MAVGGGRCVSGLHSCWWQRWSAGSRSSSSSDLVAVVRGRWSRGGDELAGGVEAEEWVDRWVSVPVLLLRENGATERERGGSRESNRGGGSLVKERWSVHGG